MSVSVILYNFNETNIYKLFKACFVTRNGVKSVLPYPLVRHSEITVIFIVISAVLLIE